METLTGMYAYSKAGHDKGTLYLIIKAVSYTHLTLPTNREV